MVLFTKKRTVFLLNGALGLTGTHIPVVCRVYFLS